MAVDNCTVSHKMFDILHRTCTFTIVARVVSQIGPNLFAAKSQNDLGGGSHDPCQLSAGLIAGINPPRLSTMRIWAGYHFPNRAALSVTIGLHLPVQEPITCSEP